MKILVFLLFGLIGLVALLLLIALFMKRRHYVRREIVIGVPVQQVFSFLRLLGNQEKFNKWAKADPNRKWEYKGTDGEKGFLISWSGNKSAGEGEKEILDIVEEKKIHTQIRFIKPMKTTADIIMETETLSPTQTKVVMINTGELSYPMNIFIPLAERNFPKDMEESLQSLKVLLERGHSSLQ